MDSLKNDALVGLVNTLQAGLDKAPAYVVDLVHRYGSYFATVNGIGLGISFILLVTFITLAVKNFNDDMEEIGAVFVFLCFVALGGVIGCSIGLAKGLLIPEIVLIHNI